MTRAAVRQGFARFVEQAIDATESAFSLSRALAGSRAGPGGAALDALVGRSDAVQRRVVEPELATHRDRTLAQFEVVLDYAESDAGIEAYREELLVADAFAASIDDGVGAAREAAVRDHLVAHRQALGDAVAPLVETPETEFWPALEAVYDEEEALELVSNRFTFSEPLREHREAFRLATTLDLGDLAGGFGALVGGGEVELVYTDEAIRAMHRAEREVIRETRRDVVERYGTDG